MCYTAFFLHIITGKWYGSYLDIQDEHFFFSHMMRYHHRVYRKIPVSFIKIAACPVLALASQKMHAYRLALCVGALLTSSVCMATTSFEVLPDGQVGAVGCDQPGVGSVISEATHVANAASGTPLLLVDSGFDPKLAPGVAGSNGLTFMREALDFFRSLGDVPVAVVAVVGPARCGKSFFLNALGGLEHGLRAGAVADNSARPGFRVDDSPLGVTRGIWVHPQTWDVERDGVVTKVVLMDVEGLGDTSRSRDDMSKLAFLATALGSQLFYNVMGTISTVCDATTSNIIY